MSDLVSGIDGLLAETQRRDQARKSAAMDEYVAIVKRADQPQAGDVEKLLGLLDTLGRTVEQFKGDVAAHRHHAKLTAGIVPADDVAALLEAQSKAWDAREDYRKAADAEIERLGRVADEATSAWRSAGDTNEKSRRAIADVEKKHPHLFARDGAATGA